MLQTIFVKHQDFIRFSSKIEFHCPLLNIPYTSELLLLPNRKTLNTLVA